MAWKYERDNYMGKMGVMAGMKNYHTDDYEAEARRIAPLSKEYDKERAKEKEEDKDKILNVTSYDELY